jgi:hypothetical protein
MVRVLSARIGFSFNFFFYGIQKISAYIGLDARIARGASMEGWPLPSSGRHTACACYEAAFLIDSNHSSLPGVGRRT